MWYHMCVTHMRIERYLKRFKCANPDVDSVSKFTCKTWMTQGFMLFSAHKAAKNGH